MSKATSRSMMAMGDLGTVFVVLSPGADPLTHRFLWRFFRWVGGDEGYEQDDVYVAVDQGENAEPVLAAYMTRYGLQ